MARSSIATPARRAFSRARLTEQIAKLDKEIEAYGKPLADNDPAEARDKSKGRSDDGYGGISVIAFRLA
jgi:hypothetical protein